MSVDTTNFKNALATFASGVTVVTTKYKDVIHGMTVSSFSSVSLEPPLILVCIAKKLYSFELIEKSGVFAVNILAAGQMDWGMRFAGMDPTIENRFEGIEYNTAKTGCPILPNTLSWLDCKVRHAYDGGDHTIFVGEVVAADAVETGEPLLYYSRAWRELSPLSDKGN